jgi:4-carboxymuconolactone decarboxylase
MARSRWDRLALRPGQLDARQRRLYASILHGPRGRSAAFEMVDESGRLQGPYGPMLLSPALGEPLQQLGSACRFESSLAPEDLEVVVLTVGHVLDAAFIVYAHTHVADRLGMRPDHIASVRAAATSQGDAVSLHQEIALSILRVGGVGTELFERALTNMTAAQLMEVVTIVGYYRLLAGLLSTFEIADAQGSTS